MEKFRTIYFLKINFSYLVAVIEKLLKRKEGKGRRFLEISRERNKRCAYLRSWKKKKKKRKKRKKEKKIDACIDERTMQFCCDPRGGARIHAGAFIPFAGRGS